MRSISVHKIKWKLVVFWAQKKYKIVNMSIVSFKV
jgi:hypothetical protein